MKKLTALFTVLCLFACSLMGCAPTTDKTGGSTTTVPSSDSDAPGIGGVRGYWYFKSDFCEAYSIDKCISDLAGPEAVLHAWVDEIKATIPAGKNLQEEINCCAFIRDMKIPREKVEGVCEWYEGIFPGRILYTDAQIDAIYNGTDEDVIREFASPYAIVIGTKIYSPKWLYEHTVEDYVAEGITFELFRSRLPQIMIPCDLEELWTTILDKYDAFRKLEEPTYTGKTIDIPAEVTVGGKTYSAQWLREHTAEDYRAAGITYELLSENIVSVIIHFPADDNRTYIYDQYAALQKLEAASATAK